MDQSAEVVAHPRQNDCSDKPANYDAKRKPMSAHSLTPCKSKDQMLRMSAGREWLPVGPDKNTNVHLVSSNKHMCVVRSAAERRP
jgi:hypothetical protein